MLWESQLELVTFCKMHALRDIWEKECGFSFRKITLNLHKIICICTQTNKIRKKSKNRNNNQNAKKQNVSTQKWKSWNTWNTKLSGYTCSNAASGETPSFYWKRNRNVVFRSKSKPENCLVLIFDRKNSIHFEFIFTTGKKSHSYKMGTDTITSIPFIILLTKAKTTIRYNSI